MSDADSILQGFLIGAFGFVGVVTVAWCLQKKVKKYNIKKSASMEELSSVETHDPTQTQDEERYASPPTLEPKVLRHTGSSSLQKQ
jgi:hypothetical protein